MQPTFVAVEVVPTAATGAEPVGIGQPKAQAGTAPAEAPSTAAAASVIPASSSAPLRRRPGGVEIRLGNGRVVKVDEGIDPAALGAIVAALDGGIG